MRGKYCVVADNAAFPPIAPLCHDLHLVPVRLLATRSTSHKPSSGKQAAGLDPSLPIVRIRRVSPIPVRPREGRLTEPTAGAQRGRRELVFMPRSRRLSSSAHEFLLGKCGAADAVVDQNVSHRCVYFVVPDHRGRFLSLMDGSPNANLVHPAAGPQCGPHSLADWQH